MRQIRDSLRLSLGAIQNVTSKAEQLGLDWEAIEQLDDQQLAQKIYPQSDPRASRTFQMPHWDEVHQQLKRKGVTKQLLWEEYIEQYPNRSYSYPQYCFLYRNWLKKQKRSMRQTHKGGDKLFVDYAGQTVPIVNGDTGEVRFAQVFVAVLGASNYTFCEATWTQGLADWLNSHARALEFIGGVPRLIVPDNLKSGVAKACRYDPDLNPSYQHNVFSKLMLRRWMNAC
jgi:transposase